MDAITCRYALAVMTTAGLYEASGDWLYDVGLPEEVAFAAVVLYRLATFYLPPVWGFFAMRWLRRNALL